MKFITKILNKMACNHRWDIHSQASVFDNILSPRPYKTKRTLICKKCGKIKKIVL